jgi:hypothetical protein
MTSPYAYCEHGFIASACARCARTEPPTLREQLQDIIDDTRRSRTPDIAEAVWEAAWAGIEAGAATVDARALRLHRHGLAGMPEVLGPSHMEDVADGIRALLSQLPSPPDGAVKR